MKRWWISWEHNEKFSGFELRTPWWCSGGGMRHANMCAAVLANDEEQAKSIIYNAYDEKPQEIRFRFVSEKPNSWSPFSDRFQCADWMEWPDNNKITATICYWWGNKENIPEFPNRSKVSISMQDLITILEKYNVMIRKNDGKYTLFIDEKKWLFKQR